MVTGHSLGAGVAVLLSMHLRSYYPGGLSLPCSAEGGRLAWPMQFPLRTGLPGPAEWG